MTEVKIIKTDKTLRDFGQIAGLAEEWERDGLGTWLAFEHPSLREGLIVASPKDSLDEVGCSVFFKTAASIQEATQVAQKLTSLYRLSSPQWMTPEGKKLIVS